MPVGLVGIIAVTAPPDAIASRRLDTSFTTDHQEIEDLGLIETIQARRFARVARVPFFEIGHRNVFAFAKAVSECVRKAGVADH